jgi:hypothetical protein
MKTKDYAAILLMHITCLTAAFFSPEARLLTFMGVVFISAWLFIFVTEIRKGHAA